MELKEVVNLRKLREEFVEDQSKGCNECPFHDVCSPFCDKEKSTCIARKMTGCFVDDRDLYELERDGELDRVQLMCKIDLEKRY